MKLKIQHIRPRREAFRVLVLEGNKAIELIEPPNTFSHLQITKECKTWLVSNSFECEYHYMGWDQYEGTNEFEFVFYNKSHAEAFIEKFG